jgi:hypothetical protein
MPSAPWTGFEPLHPDLGWSRAARNADGIRGGRTCDSVQSARANESQMRAKANAPPLRALRVLRGKLRPAPICGHLRNLRIEQKQRISRITRMGSRRTVFCAPWRFLTRRRGARGGGVSHQAASSRRLFPAGAGDEGDFLQDHGVVTGGILMAAGRIVAELARHVWIDAAPVGGIAEP